MIPSLKVGCLNIKCYVGNRTGRPMFTINCYFIKYSRCCGTACVKPYAVRSQHGLQHIRRYDAQYWTMSHYSTFDLILPIYTKMLSLLLLLWLFRHSAKSSIAQEERARDGSEVSRAVSRRCYLHTGNVGHSWCLGSSLSLSIGYSIQDEAMNVDRSAPQGLTTMRTLFICFLD